MGRKSVMLQVLGGRLQDFFRQASRPWCWHHGSTQRNVLEPPIRLTNVNVTTYSEIHRTHNTFHDTSTITQASITFPAFIVATSSFSTFLCLSESESAASPNFASFCGVKVLGRVCFNTLERINGDDRYCAALSNCKIGWWVASTRLGKAIVKSTLLSFACTT